MNVVGMQNRVIEVTGSTARRLRAGSVVGGGDVMRPLTRPIAFASAHGGTGCVLAVELSTSNGEVTKATAVRVLFGS
jgi:hypothetical protein